MCRNISEKHNEENNMKLKKIMLLAVMVALPSVGLSVEENHSANNDKTYTKDEVIKFLNTTNENNFVYCKVSKDQTNRSESLSYLKSHNTVKTDDSITYFYRVLGSTFAQIKTEHEDLDVQKCVQINIPKNMFLEQEYFCKPTESTKKQDLFDITGFVKEGDNFTKEINCIIRICVL